MPPCNVLEHINISILNFDLNLGDYEKMSDLCKFFLQHLEII
jgi:hypothetical protein